MGLDIKIIEEAQRGKAYAQGKIYDLYSGAMLGICVRYLGNIADAEDVLQEGFIKVFRSLDKADFNTVSSFSAWIKRIMINTALNHIRNQKKYSLEEWNDNYAHDIPEEAIVDEADSFTQEELLEMIQQLPEGYRMVFNLYVFEKYSHQEIAEVLGISQNTSKTQLFKARRYLQKKLFERMKINIH
jgi:RNA polymerase sigma-70 factor (ECF subfamily)